MTIPMSELERLIKPDRYQVLVLSCPANVPIFFALHTWIVVNKKGTLSRWGVSFRLRKRELSWGHINKNMYPLFQGIEMFAWRSKPVWKHVRLIGLLEGGEGSDAQRMADFVECSPQTYPYRDRYALPGPNSNTYVQWVLAQFLESGIRLPWNAIGKNFRP